MTRLTFFRQVPTADEMQTAETLTSYAADSLSPDTEALSRMSIVVRAAFADSPVSREAAPASGVGSAGRSGMGGLILGRRRRTIASLCAVAVLTLSSVSFAGAESNPGQPFYRLRLSLEGVRLPFEQPANQVQSDLDRADARLGDVEHEVAAGDWNAAADATGAYIEVVNAIKLPADAAARAAALQRLDLQLTSLQKMRLTSMAPETAALDRAIAAVCGLLGIAVPTPPASPTARPTAGSDGHASAEPSQKRPGGDGPGSPGTRPGPGKPDSSGRPDGPNGDHATPTSQDPDRGGHPFGGRPRR